MTLQERLAFPSEPIRPVQRRGRWDDHPGGFAAWWAEEQQRREAATARQRAAQAEDRARLALCPLKGPRAGEPGRCGLCGGELPRTKAGHIHPNRRWCSTACSDTYWQNHGWGQASWAALRRDGWRCRRCGHPGYGGSAAPPGHFTDEERRSLRPLEVNHRIPRNGRGYHEGCHHHLEDLETLCRPCHGQETSRQMRARRLARGLRVLIGIRTGELRVDYHARRVERSPEALPEPIWADL